MKKICIAIFIFIFLLSGQKANTNFSLLNYFEGDYYAYVETAQYGGTNLGICHMIEKNVEEKIGESMTIYNFEPIAAIKTLNAKIVKTEQLETGATVIYAYTSLISTSVEVDGQKVNLQFAHYLDHTVVGWPLILGSF